MTNDHWFDRLNKALVRLQPRRALLQAAGAIVTAHIFGDGSDAEAAKNRNKNKQKNRNRNRNKNKKRRPKPKPKRTCSRGVCRRQWSKQTEEDRNDRRSCEITCKRCKRTRTELCILEGDPDNLEKFADCCPEGEPCCGDKCCPAWPTDEGLIPSKCCGKDKCCPETWDCCDGACCPRGDCCETDIGKVCLSAGNTCCPDDAATGWCGPGEECCPGIGCVPEGECLCANSSGECCNVQCPDVQDCCPHPGLVSGFECTVLDFDRDNCGSCGITCPPNARECCFGECVDTLSDVRYCGTCGLSCRPGQVCFEGDCWWEYQLP